MSINTEISNTSGFLTPLTKCPRKLHCTMSLKVGSSGMFQRFIFQNLPENVYSKMSVLKKTKTEKK